MRAGLLAILCLGLVLRLVGLGAPALTGDEAHAWACSARLAPGYLEHPPGTALILSLVGAARPAALPGGAGADEASAPTGADATLRLPSALLGASMPGAAFVAAEALAPGAGLLAAAAVAAAPPFVVLSRLATPNGLVLPFEAWALALAARWAARRQRAPRSLMLALALAGAGAELRYSSYPILAAIAGFALVFEPRALLRAWPGLVAAGLLVAPNLAYEAAHGFVAFRFHLGALAGPVAPPAPAREAAAGALAFLSAPLAILLAAALLPPWPRRRGEGPLFAAALLVLAPPILGGLSTPRYLAEGAFALLVVAAARLSEVAGGGARRGAGEAPSPASPALDAPAAGASAERRGARPLRWLRRSPFFLLAAWLFAAGFAEARSMAGASPLASGPARPQLASGAGIRELAAKLAAGEAAAASPAAALPDGDLALPVWLFTPEPSLYGQLARYSGLPAFSSWPQAPLGAPPSLARVVVVATYPPDPAPLAPFFSVVSAPRVYEVETPLGPRALYAVFAEGGAATPQALRRAYSLPALLPLVEAAEEDPP